MNDFIMIFGATLLTIWRSRFGAQTRVLKNVFPYIIFLMQTSCHKKTTAFWVDLKYCQQQVTSLNHGPQQNIHGANSKKLFYDIGGGGGGIKKSF